MPLHGVKIRSLYRRYRYLFLFVSWMRMWSGHQYHWTLPIPVFRLFRQSKSIFADDSHNDLVVHDSNEPALGVLPTQQET